MVRFLGVILIITGFILFFGNFSGSLPNIPGLGIVTVMIGGIVFAFAERFDALPPGNEE